jgi:hypothetical protein
MKALWLSRNGQNRYLRGVVAHAEMPRVQREFSEMMRRAFRNSEQRTEAGSKSSTTRGGSSRSAWVSTSWRAERRTRFACSSAS